MLRAGGFAFIQMAKLILYVTFGVDTVEVLQIVLFKTYPHSFYREVVQLNESSKVP